MRGLAAAQEEGSRRGKEWGSHEVKTRDLGPGKTKKPQTVHFKNKHVYRVDQKKGPTFLGLAYK